MNKIGIGLGYSEGPEEDSLHGEWLMQTFGRFTSLRFHLEETSDTTIRLTVESDWSVAISAINERFGGQYMSRHRTKLGKYIDLYYSDGWLLISPHEIVTALPEPKVAAVA